MLRSAMMSLPVLLVAAGACMEEVHGPAEESVTLDARPAVPAPALRVMTRNVYVGADVDRVLTAGSPTEIPVLVEIAFQELLSTDFVERAGALAEEIRIHRPHLIGLQEVSLIRTQSPGDAAFGGVAPAETVVFDYLEILLAALAERGLDYRVAAAVQNMDIEVPRANALPPDDVRVTDFDVILAQTDVETSIVVARNYDVVVRIAIGGPSGPVVTIPRGYVIVDAVVGGHTFRIANTHLEQSSFGSEIQEAQAEELLGALTDGTRPVVVLGDFNSQADGGSTPTYGNVLAAGYLDAWIAKRGVAGRSGFTCCHDSDLRNIGPALVKRIDFVFFRPAATGLSLDLVRASVVGGTSRERTKSGLWPSDHAGVVAEFRAPAVAPPH